VWISQNFKIHWAGCLQLLEILEISWNLKTLLEVLEISCNLIGPPGNFCVNVEDRPHWFPVIKIWINIWRKNTKFIAIRCVFSTSRCTKTRFGPGLRLWPLWGAYDAPPDSYSAGRAEMPIKYPYYGFQPPKEAEARQTCPGFFLKSLLEICSIKFVDTPLMNQHDEFIYPQPRKVIIYI